jgi:ATP-binding cassette subfamily B protein
LKRAPALIAWLALPVTGCAGLAPVREPGWIETRDVPVVRQKAETDCGAAALAMMLSYWGVPTTLEEMVAACPPDSTGIRAAALRDHARGKGLSCFIIAGEFADLEGELSKGRPVLVGLLKPQGDRWIAHYEVVVGLHPERKRIELVDPARGRREDSWEKFAEEWTKASHLAMVLFRGE